MFNAYNHIHFVGIGGIGVSALARLALEAGKQVSGTDLVATEVTKDLEHHGARLFIGADAASSLPAEAEAVIYTVAAQESAQLLAAREHRTPVFSYPEAVGEMTRAYATVAIAGTHGKTTTTALTGLILAAGDLDPTVIVGSNTHEFQGNARAGKGKHLVLEADEYRRAFLQYDPTIAILTRVEFDHPDCYRDLDDVREAFTSFCNRLVPQGTLVMNNDDPVIREMIKNLEKPVVTISVSGEADVMASEIHEGERTTFTVNSKRFGIMNEQCDLAIPGIFNVSNALAAMTAGLVLGVPFDIARKAVASYRGAWRRFEIKAEAKGITLIDDYAHHPTEVAATLAAARARFGSRRIVAVFQPHQKKRTKELFGEFAHAFSSADELLLMDIYEVAGREEAIPVSSKELAEEIHSTGGNVSYVKTPAGVLDYLSHSMKKGDVVLLMGAGDITLLGPAIISLIRRHA